MTDEYEALFKDREHAILYRTMRGIDGRVLSLEETRRFGRKTLKFTAWFVGIALSVTTILLYAGVFR